MSGTECGGGMRGLAWLPWEAAEVMEGNSEVGGFPRGSEGTKLQAAFPSLQ